ncbi:MAG: CHASE3 domain-containing protein, partial [Streptosporangiaceae bacterium]
MTDVNADTEESPANSPSAAGAAGANGANGANGARPARRTVAAHRKAALADAAKRWPLSRITGVAVLALLLFSVAAMVAGGVALLSLRGHRERVVTTLDPAAVAVRQLDNALLNQETGVRGYALSGQPSFLAPYTNGVAAEKAAIASLQQVAGQLPPSVRADLANVINQAHFWRTDYAEPAIAEIRASGKPVVSPGVIAGKADFDALRARIATLEADISAARAQAVAALDDSATALDAVFIAVAVG